MPLKLFVPPIELPPLRISAQWHRSRDGDGATRWLRDLVLQTSRDLGFRE